MAGPSLPPQTTLQRPCQLCHDKKRACELISPCQRCRDAGMECVEWEKNAPPAQNISQTSIAVRGNEQRFDSMSPVRGKEKKIVILRIRPDLLKRFTASREATALPYLATFFPEKRAASGNFPQSCFESLPLWDEIGDVCQECEEPRERHAFWCSSGWW